MARESRRPAREAEKLVADPASPDDEWNLSPLPISDHPRARAERVNAGGLEHRELEANEITMEDIDRFGRDFALPGEEAQRTQPEVRREKPRSALDRAREISDVCAGVGDASCDSLLYQSDQPNRVYLSKVLDDTLASDVGLRAGDEIIRVGEERIFSVFDLRDALADQSEGPPVIIEVLRDGTPMLVTIPAGEKLGAPFGSRKVPPLPE